MAKYNKNELYFFKFPNNFFERDEVEEILCESDGASIIVFYLRLLLLAVNKMGYLCKIISGELKPYSIIELCKKTDTDIEEFKNWTKRLNELGLIELKNDMIFIEDALKYTNQTIGAFKKQLQRNSEDICPPNCPPEKDIRNKNIDIRNQKSDIINNIIKEKDNSSYSFEQLLQQEREESISDSNMDFYY